MQVTKEIYEKVVKECNGDLDLAHEVVMKLYDYRCTSHYPGAIIKSIKESVLEERKDPEFVEFNLDDVNVLEQILCENIKSCFLELERRELKENIDAILLELIQMDQGKSERNAEFIIERYMNGKSYKQISDEFGVTPERVRNVVSRYLRKFRQPSRAKYIEDFLFDSYLYL